MSGAASGRQEPVPVLSQGLDRLENSRRATHLVDEAQVDAMYNRSAGRALPPHEVINGNLDNVSAAFDACRS